MTSTHSPAEPRRTFVGHLRDWVEALAIAFIVAMFVRAFVFEMFRVPSGSMSPTIIGDLACEVDVDGNGELDQVVVHPGSEQRVQVFYSVDGQHRGVDNFRYDGMPMTDPRFMGSGRVQSLPQHVLTMIQHRAVERYDRILVNKFSYWFNPVPRRGDIMVFKVPPPEFKVERPIYIKRVAGLPGESVGVGQDGELLVNGERVTSPAVHERIFYAPLGGGRSQLMQPNPVQVPDDAFLAFGDNSFSSRDSRYWGPVPLANLKGKAFMRYLPLGKAGFLE